VYLGPEGGWGKSSPLDEKIGPWVIELAQVQVTNIGRTPVSVSDIGIDAGRSKWWRRGRFSLRGFPVLLLQGIKDEVVNLKPGDTVWVYFDLWQLVESGRKRKIGRTLTIRGTAWPAGRRTRRSPWRLRWRIAAAQTTLRPDAKRAPEAELQAFHALWHWLRSVDKDKEHFLSPWWHAIQPMLVAGKSAEEIAESMHEVWGDVVTSSMAAHQTHRAYEAACRSLDAEQ
jgi:hypothetical protein